MDNRNQKINRTAEEWTPLRRWRRIKRVARDYWKRRLENKENKIKLVLAVNLKQDKDVTKRRFHGDDDGDNGDVEGRYWWWQRGLQLT